MLKDEIKFMYVAVMERAEGGSESEE